MNNYVRIFDTTLRDGEQSPGATMTSAEKLEVAHSLARPRRGHYRSGISRRISRRPRSGQTDSA